MKKLLVLAILVSIFSCQKEKIQVDSIVINGNIYTVNGNFDKAEAFAIKDGKFLELASSEMLKKNTQQIPLLMHKAKLLFQVLLMRIVIFMDWA